MIMKFFQFIWVVILLTCIGCSSHKAEAPTTKSITVENPRALSDSSEFTLGPGDQIAISVWRNVDLDRSVTLDPSGKIRIPLAGEIDASCMTVSQLNKEIEARLSKYIDNPFVDINVTSISSRKIHVMGEIRSPGTFSYTEQIPAWEAVSKAGGFTDDANNKNLLLVRVKGGEASISLLELDFEKIFETGMIKGNYYLQNGDILYVPETNIASVEKFMIRLNNIITPIYTIERMIYLAPDVIDILSGKEIKRQTTIAQ